MTKKKGGGKKERTQWNTVVMTISFPTTNADLLVDEAELASPVLLFEKTLIETCLFIALFALSGSCLHSSLNDLNGCDMRGRN